MLKTIRHYQSKTFIFLSLFISSAMLPIVAAPAPTTPTLQYSSLVRLPLTIDNTLIPNAAQEQWTEELKQAFYNPRSAEVILYVNCIGGEALASHAIYQLIKNLKKETGKPVYAFVDSVCGSGGYLIACAADAIVCHHDWTLVGSVGAVGTFRNTFQAEKLAGIQIVSIASADAKKDLSLMDPNSEEFKEALKRVQVVLMASAECFADIVIQSRGTKLMITREELLKAHMYPTKEAFKHGLIDGIMDGPTFMRQYCRGVCAVESVRVNNETYRLVSPFFLQIKKHLLARGKHGKLALLIHQE